MGFAPRELSPPIGVIQSSNSLTNPLYKLCLIAGVFSESIVILLSVKTVSVRGLFSGIFIFSTASIAFSMANCSAWMLEHLLSSLH